MPHIIFMFIALLVGVRTAVGAAFHPVGLRKLAWTTLGLMTVGGMILGPIVQKYAFGAFWTGWPFGYDLTDNKTLIMWIVWVGVAVVLAKRHLPQGLDGPGSHSPGGRGDDDRVPHSPQPSGKRAGLQRGG